MRVQGPGDGAFCGTMWLLKGILLHYFPWWQMISCLVCASSILLVASVFIGEDPPNGRLDATALNEDAETCLKVSTLTVPGRKRQDANSKNCSIGLTTYEPASLPRFGVANY